MSGEPIIPKQPRDLPSRCMAFREAPEPLGWDVCGRPTANAWSLCPDCQWRKKLRAWKAESRQRHVDWLKPENQD